MVQCINRIDRSAFEWKVSFTTLEPEWSKNKLWRNILIFILFHSKIHENADLWKWRKCIKQRGLYRIKILLQNWFQYLLWEMRKTGEKKKKKKESNFRIATTRKNGAPCIARKVQLGGVTEWMMASCYMKSKLCNQVRSLDHFVVQNSGDFLCWKYKEVVCFYVSNLLQ